VNPAKTKEFFDTLRAACARQFAFNPRRITAEMRYVGTEGHGKDIVHVFRDLHTHSQIALQGTYATLRETHGDKAHWTEIEQAHYRSSDAEIDAEIAAKQAELDYVSHCQLYLDHREQLLSHYKDWPGYQAGSTSPREAARVLVDALAAANDARLAAFAEQLQSNDPEYLAHHLLAPCRADIDATKGATGH
jgi:hypothetical protein